MQFSCLSLLSAEIIGICHHDRLLLSFSWIILVAINIYPFVHVISSYSPKALTLLPKLSSYSVNKVLHHAKPFSAFHCP
jgi:hypothetical protein